MRLELGVEAALEDAADQKGSLDGVEGPARLDHGLDLVHQTGRVGDIGNRRQQELARERLAHAADAHISFRSRTCLYSDRGIEGPIYIGGRQALPRCGIIRMIEEKLR